MSNEFSTAISEGMSELQSLAGSVWVWESQRKEFTAVQKTDSGVMSLIDGGLDYGRTVTLICSKNDFAGGVPAKMSVVYRKDSPYVKYKVEKDTSTENDVDPTFTLDLALSK